MAIVKCGVDYKQLNMKIAQAWIPNWMSTSLMENYYMTIFEIGVLSHFVFLFALGILFHEKVGTTVCHLAEEKGKTIIYLDIGDLF